MIMWPIFGHGDTTRAAAALAGRRAHTHERRFGPDAMSYD